MIFTARRFLEAGDPTSGKVQVPANEAEKSVNQEPKKELKKESKKDPEPPPSDEKKNEKPPENPISKADLLKLQSRIEEQNKIINAFKEREEKEKEEKLREQGKWQDLYNSEKEKRARLEETYKALEIKVEHTAKKAAFLREVGTLSKPSYEKHIDLDKITIKEDGSIDEESVKSYAEKFRNEFPELLKTKPSNMPNKAPKPGGDVTKEEKPGDLNSLLQQASKNGSLFLKGRGVD